MPWARIDGDRIAEIITENPATLFTPAIAVLFVQVPDEAVYRAQLVDGVWLPPGAMPGSPSTGPVDPDVAAYYAQAGLARRRRQFTKRLAADPLAALVQQAKDNMRW